MGDEYRSRRGFETASSNNSNNTNDRNPGGNQVDTQYIPVRQKSIDGSSSTTSSRLPTNSTSQKDNITNQRDPEDIFDLNAKTLDLVADFKREIQGKIMLGQPNVKPCIELAVAHIRCDKDREHVNVDKWKKELPYDLKKCPDNILRLLIAYGDDPKQLESVLQVKMNEIALNTSAHSSKNCTDTSLDEIKGPLKRLKKDLDGEKMPTLFQAVLAINDDEIDRADRMFFSEMRHNYPKSASYELEYAHDVVQAIRLMNFETGTKTELTYLIDSCKTFDDSYSYLRECTKRNMRSEQGTAASSTNRQRDSAGKRDNEDSNISTTSKSNMIVNRNQQPSSKPDSSSSGSGNTAGRGTTDEQRGNGSGGPRDIGRSNNTGDKSSTSPRYGSTIGRGTTNEQRGDGNGGSSGTGGTNLHTVRK